MIDLEGSAVKINMEDRLGAWQKDPDERYVEASKFTRRVDIFKKQFIFIPVCRSGHWFLSLIYNLPTLTSRRRKDDGCAVVPCNSDD